MGVTPTCFVRSFTSESVLIISRATSAGERREYIADAELPRVKRKWTGDTVT